MSPAFGTSICLAAHDCTVTGTTRDGVWWIEDGELAYPVDNLRFDQSLVDALADIARPGARPADRVRLLWRRLPRAGARA